ncbi:hypothetical protein AB0J52_39055, partial [Spirillospora sp. NPDC049652]
MRWFPGRSPRTRSTASKAPPPSPSQPQPQPLSLLLGRDEVAVTGPRARRLVRGRRVLVTGACGTVGS